MAQPVVRGGLRQKRRQGTIDGFVDAALELLVEHGYEALTLAKVAERVEYAVGAIYRYFASKDELLVAVQVRVLDQLFTEVQTALATIDKNLQRARTISPRDAALLRLMAVPLVQETFATEKPAYFAMLSAQLTTPRILVTDNTSAAPAFQALMRLNGALATLLEEAAQKGALDAGNAARRAVVLWASHQGILQLRKLARWGQAALAMEHMSIDAIGPLLVGWGADADAVATLYARAKKLLAPAD